MGLDVIYDGFGPRTRFWTWAVLSQWAGACETVPPETKEARIAAGSFLSTPTRARTLDKRIKSPLLYQLSYRGVFCGETIASVTSTGQF